MIPKGSIAVDGISLTIASLDGARVGVQIVPFTWRTRRSQHARAGDAVNLEADVIGKYVARLIACVAGSDAASHDTQRSASPRARRKRSPFAPIEDAIAAIRAGRMIIVVDDEDRENEGDLTMAASQGRRPRRSTSWSSTAAGSSAWR